jgi:hypothetical protein
MEHAKRVRVIKRGLSGHEAESSRDTTATGHVGNASRDTGDAGREVRDVVSDWVRDHRRRAEEFRRNYSILLGEVGFKSPHECGRAA